MRDDAEIARHGAKWPGCTCPWGWGSYGRLYGQSMGSGPCRTKTDPACPCHGDAAWEQWKKDHPR